jgi:hypothetical protein
VDRIGDVLQVLAPEVLDRIVEAATHVAVDARRDADRPRTRQRAQPGGDVDRVAEGGSPRLDQHVAEMDSYAKPERSLAGRLRGQLFLHL